MTDQDTSRFFITGGNLEANAPSYVKRPVDDELFDLVLAGEFCYGLTARQMGKSSLMVRTAQRLQAHEVRTVIIDLTTIGSEDIRIEQWYLGLLTRIQSQLKLSVDLETWWQNRVSLGAVQRFLNSLHDVVLTEIEEPVVIFIDEIDTTLNLKFSDDFFAAIRAIYNARATDLIFQRLTFVLFGVATPGDLIKDRSRTPFNIGQRLDIREFTRKEAQVLQQGLQAVYPDHGEAIFNRIFYWTYGHPYLTQKLCRSVTESVNRVWTDEQIDQLIEKLFLSEEARTETNLQFVRDNIQENTRQRQLLTLYRQVHTGQVVSEDERSPEQNRLKLLGLVRVEKGTLKVRNEIYRRAFDLAWIKANTPSDRTRQIIVASVVVIILLMFGIGFVFYRQEQQTIEARATTAAENFRIPSAEVRLDSLAQLFDLGFETDARRLFYELEPTEQKAVFNLNNPRDVETQLIAVVKGLYTDPRVNEEDDQLLQAMAQPLFALHDTDNHTAKNLAIEIENWLEGREYYDQGEYQQAIMAYETAISLNDENPTTYFDRALAHTALNHSGQALTDFETVLSLGNEAWQTQVQQVVIKNDQLYSALWSNGRVYRELAALIPTPTPTKTPTRTPTSTDTPTLTRKPTPILPTSTDESTRSTQTAEAIRIANTRMPIPTDEVAATITALAQEDSLFAFYGYGDENSDGTDWTYRYFDRVAQPVTGVPRVGDEVIAIGSVNARAGYIEYIEGQGWTNQPIIGLINPGDKCQVLEVKRVLPRFIWVKCKRSD